MIVKNKYNDILYQIIWQIGNGKFYKRLQMQRLMENKFAVHHISCAEAGYIAEVKRDIGIW